MNQENLEEFAGLVSESITLSNTHVVQRYNTNRLILALTICLLSITILDEKAHFAEEIAYHFWGVCAWARA